MSLIFSKLDNIKGAWKQLALLTTWLAAIAGSFLLPLPGWASEASTASYSKFTLFIATILCGFLLLLAVRNKNRKFWMILSIGTFVLFIACFFMYSIFRERLTLPYDGSDTVVGKVRQSNFQQKITQLEKETGHSINQKDLLYYAGGDPTQFWTEESIEMNRWTLVALYMLVYCSLAFLLMSFLNTIIIYNSSNET